jgi:hypothetical protein
MTTTQQPSGETEVQSNAEVCRKCEGGGWECYGIGRNDPHFRECDECENPEGHPSP